MFLDQITPLILTFNEAPNIGRTLEKLSWARDIVVVDSFSDDQTEVIAKSFAAVRFFQRRFDTHANQWNFGLLRTEIKTPWVIALDADYVLTDELISELAALTPEATTNGFRANFIYCISGKQLRSGIYPPATALFRRECASFKQDGHTQRLSVEGEILSLQSRILHDDRKPLSRWFVSQAHYTELEAQKLLRTKMSELSWPDRLRRLTIFAPWLMLFYCLFLRAALFDGWAGFRYVFERTVAELMLSMYLIQQRIEGRQRSSQASLAQTGDRASELEVQNSQS